ncbi:MAG: hypothetical protein A2Y33_15795 [Spirochaetes bacterium GWF1_51_8]|nr:MAG: hypothetical protein A2Y33_15795 [Spirochaetes bacterium GWF1_51_8]
MAEQAKRVSKILRSGEYSVDPHKFVIQTPKIFKRTKEQEIDESSKRIDELRTEISELEKQISEKNDKADHDADEIVLKAEQEAERIVDNAEKSAFERVKKSLDDKENVILEKNTESGQIIEQSRQDGRKIVEDAHVEAEHVRDNARKEGFEQGRTDGFQAAKLDVQHMVERLHSIVAATLEERERILLHSEQQVLNLVMTMVEKVVKRLTHEERNVVVNNVREALQLIRGAMRVYIHVNPEDYHYTISHKDEFISMIEGMPEVKFFENPKVDRGGVYIETDIGEVDATIATQLSDIIDKIKFYIPVQVDTELTRRRPLGTLGAKSLDQELKDAGTIDSHAVESASIPDYMREPAPQKQSITQFGTQPIEAPKPAPAPAPIPQPQPVQQAKPVQAQPQPQPQSAPQAHPQPKPAPQQIKKSPEQLEAERKKQIAEAALKPVGNAPLRDGDVNEFAGEPAKPAMKPPEPKPAPVQAPAPVETIMGSEIVEEPLNDDFLNSIDEIEVPDIDISHLRADDGGIPADIASG